MSELIIADEFSPFNPSPEEWEEMTRAITAGTENRAAWPNVSAERIISDLRKIKKKVERAKWEVPGVTVIAGRIAYAEIRQTLPDDSEMVKVVECSYLGERECLVVKNEGIAYLNKCSTEMSRRASTIPTPKRPESSDSSGPKQSPHHSG